MNRSVLMGVFVTLAMGGQAVFNRDAQAMPPIAPQATTRPRQPAVSPPTSTTTAPSIPSPPSTPATAPQPPPPGANKPPRPVDAAGALERVRAAYEYGDIDEMVESARQVSEGTLHPTPSERASALRYLGIGLFLTGRTEGAETAFFELLRLRPESRLDPQTTRPDAVAFFEQVRLRHEQPIRDAARANNRKVFALNFLPPGGQFQNGHPGRAYTIASFELVSLGTAITTFALLKHWEQPGKTSSNPEGSRAAKVLNWGSIGVLAATVLFGVIDGIAHYPDIPDDTPPPSTARLSVGPTGLALDF